MVKRPPSIIFPYYKPWPVRSIFIKARQQLQKRKETEKEAATKWKKRREQL
jgi:hypothetical protein